tara:strand:- start:1387 stop:1656 length:270 start_codon:yes stop_codon:yes gene_type:complete
MLAIKRFRVFNDSLFEQHPDLYQFLKPKDIYPELKKALKKRPINLPTGSLNTKIVINNGHIVERVFKTPEGQLVSLFSESSTFSFEKAA